MKKQGDTSLVLLLYENIEGAITVSEQVVISKTDFIEDKMSKDEMF